MCVGIAGGRGEGHAVKHGVRERLLGQPQHLSHVVEQLVRMGRQTVVCLANPKNKDSFGLLVIFSPKKIGI